MEKQLVKNHILYEQSHVVELLLKSDPSLADYLWDTEAEILEWWLITPYLADLLRAEAETVITTCDCHWWGRTTSGQAIEMDSVIAEICKRCE